MSRWSGSVGFVKTEDKGYGVFEPVEIKRPYFGDTVVDVRRIQDQERSTNPSLSLNTRISMVADEFALKNLAHMRWVEYMGAKWSITSATVQFPRIELNFGSVYVGEEEDNG